MLNSITINLQGAFKRTVSFIIGMCLAPYIMKGIKVNSFYVIGVSAFGCILFHFLMKEVFYSWLYVLPLLIVLCIVFEKLPKKSRLNIFFLWLGAASLESYLANVGIKALMPSYLDSWINSPIFSGHYLDYTLVIIVGFILTYIVHGFSNAVASKTQIFKV